MIVEIHIKIKQFINNFILYIYYQFFLLSESNYFFIYSYVAHAVAPDKVYIPNLGPNPL